MKQIIEQIKQIKGVKTITPYTNSESSEQMVIVVFGEKEKHPLFVNSKGDEFYEGDMCWWYEKESIRIVVGEIDKNLKLPKRPPTLAKHT